MEGFESISACTTLVEDRLPYSFNFDEKTISADNFVKVNGDNNVPQNIFPSDNEISTSSSSSSSPRNLIIDHQDEAVKNDIEEVRQQGEKELVLAQSKEKPLKRYMKRKLSLRDMTNPYLLKKRRFSTKSMEMNFSEKQPINQLVSLCPLEFTEDKHLPPFQKYTNYLGLKPTLPIKCFKCSNAYFETLPQLRDHQKICLFKDKQRNLLLSKEQSIPPTTCNSFNTKFDEVSLIGSSKQSVLPSSSSRPSNSNVCSKTKKRVFLCSACGTYYENWNLFLHMREVHKRHICLYCIGMFPTAERLTFHLEMKHDLEQNHYDCQENLLRSSRDSCYLMCCVCEHLFTEHDDFSEHKCSDHIQPCSLCDHKGKHSANCKGAVKSLRLKNKDCIGKRKSRNALKNALDLDSLQDKRVDSILNENKGPETSILRQIISDLGGRCGIDDAIPSPIKLNGCAENVSSTSIRDENIDGHLIIQPDSSVSQFSNNFNPNHEHRIDYLPQNISPGSKAEGVDILHSRAHDSLPEAINLIEHNTNDIDTVRSQSNINSDTILSTSNTSEKALNNLAKCDEILKSVSDPPVLKPLFVPKFTIKVPKEYQAPVESELSSTESEDNEIDHCENVDGSNSDTNLEEVKERSDEKPIKCDNAENEATIEGNHARRIEDEGMEKPQMGEYPNAEGQKYSTGGEYVERDDLNLHEKVKEEKEQPHSPSDGIFVADENVVLQDLLLDRPLDKISIIDFIRICLRATYRTCLYCNHARNIAVNADSFVSHLISQHRFSATVDSITAEELQPATIVQKLKISLPELESTYLNLATYCSDEKENNKPYQKTFECFQCRFETKIHKELYLHNRKMHLKTAILCFMCRLIFFSYSEILCHMCPGIAGKCVIFDIKFRCCLCDFDDIPSAFRLMVHLRKRHFACDVCLENCYDQSRLSSHVWKHKLHHLCYRCGIAYRNKPDITKHLFWKHGTESVLCKRCLQKRWPHVYHFCIAPTSFICEVCNQSFSKAVALKVHRRLHTGCAPYTCPENSCDQKFISRKLLLKHSVRHNEVPETMTEMPKEKVLKLDLKEELGTSAEGKKSIKGDEIIKINENALMEQTPKRENDQSMRKRKKSKRNKDNIADLVDLPAPNLSESDSSNESDEKITFEKIAAPISEPILSPLTDSEQDTVGISNVDKMEKDTQILDIWANFKTFQASQAAKTLENDLEDIKNGNVPSILHVTQSDHDYCLMFKSISKLPKSLSKGDMTEIKADGIENETEHQSPKKKQKATRKMQKSDSESSSSCSSSSSDSSCSCGSNCSCTSSSNSPSDSSSNSDSESSSQGRKRSTARRAAKQEKKNRQQIEESSYETEFQSPKANTSDIVDVVTTDANPQVDPDSIIFETDLDTDESDTDEDFYDEHPQKLANQILAEKRKQLLMQTSLSPSHTFDFVENSRPSTPSIPEDMIKEKKVKMKKKKREKKVSKTVISAAPELEPPDHLYNTAAIMTYLENVSASEFLEHSNMTGLSATTILAEDIQSCAPNVPEQTTQTTGIANSLMPAQITQKNRPSTGSNSDPDTSLKRSKRRRRPNKFYGYSSDDDMNVASAIPGSAAFKPTPPPNLTWRKEDLPAPNSKTFHYRKFAASHRKSTASTSANTLPLPPIPPIVIRPKKTLSVEAVQYKPPIVQPARVPPVPVHHIRPPQYSSPNRVFDASETSSDDDHRLTIMTTIGKGKYKGRQRKQKQSLQLQHQQTQQQLQPYSYQQPQSPLSVPAPPAPAPMVSQRVPHALLPNPDPTMLDYFKRNGIRYPIQPPAGARPPREGESVYCYCRCPYDEVSEMIACDGDNCIIEWFHFECVGILVAPQGKWFCPECRPLFQNEAAAAISLDPSNL